MSMETFETGKYDIKKIYIFLFSCVVFGNIRRDD